MTNKLGLKPSGLAQWGDPSPLMRSSHKNWLLFVCSCIGAEGTQQLALKDDMLLSPITVNSIFGKPSLHWDSMERVTTIRMPLNWYRSYLVGWRFIPFEVDWAISGLRIEPLKFDKIFRMFLPGAFMYSFTPSEDWTRLSTQLPKCIMPREMTEKVTFYETRSWTRSKSFWPHETWYQIKMVTLLMRANKQNFPQKMLLHFVIFVEGQKRFKK